MRKLQSLGLLIFSFFLMLVLSSPVFGTTTTFYSQSIDGFLYRTGTTYPPTATYSNPDDTLFRVGQIKDAADNFYIYRGYVSFDTSSIPDNATIVSATIRVRCVADASDTDFDIRLYSGSYGSSLDTGDWDNVADYEGIFLNTAGITVGSWYEYSVSVGSVNKTGRSQYKFVSSREGTEPTGYERVSFNTEESTSDPELIVEYAAYSPTNDGLSLTNPSIGAQGCLAQKQAYIFQVNVTDSDGGTNLNYVDLTLDQGGQNLSFRWTESTDVFSEEFDPNGYVSISSTSADSNLVGNQWTLDFKLTFAWIYPDENTHDVKVYSLDDNSLSDEDTYSNIYYVENDLIFSDLTVDDYRVNPSQVLTMNGIIYYQGTTIVPNDGDYQVKVKLSGVQKGTDTTLVNGYFSINDVTAETTVASYSYTVEATYMAGAGSFSAVIVDRFKIVSIVADDDRRDVSTTVTLDVTIDYEYDNTDVTTGSFTLEGTSLIHQGSGVWRRTDSKATVQAVVYDTVAGSGDTYGLNTVNMNGQSETVIWDRIEVYSQTLDDSRVDVNSAIEFRVQARLDYDNHTLGSGDSLTANTGAMSWDSVNSWFNVSRTESTVTSYTFTVTSGSEATYGITAIYVGVSNPTGVWDRIKITGMGNDDGRRDVGTTGTFWATALLEYDNHPLGSGDSLTISGKAMTWNAGNNRFEVTDSKSTVQAVTYDTFTSGNEATHGITVGTMSGYSTTIIWDRFEFVSVSADDTRINVGGNFELRYKIRYDYDNVTFSSSKGSITGFTWDSANSWWDKSVTGSSSATSTNYDETYVSITDSTYNLTAKQDVVGVDVITDRIHCTATTASDNRDNIDDNVNIDFTLKYDYDETLLTDGTVTIEGFSASHQGSGVWRITRTSAAVTSVTYNEFTATGNTHGISEVSMDGQSGETVIWDRLELWSASASDTRINVGGTSEIRFKVRYDYDDVAFDSADGSLSIGGVSATWDATNSWWDATITHSSSVTSTLWDYNDMTFTDNTYGLTAKTGISSVSVVTDRLELWSVTFDDSRVNVGATVEVRFKVRYDYDDVIFDSTKGSLNIEGSAATWDGTNSWWDRSITQSSSVGSNLYDVNDLTFTDSTYGLTAKVGIASGSVITDRIEIYSQALDDSRTNIGDNIEFRVQARLDYDNHALGSGDSLSANFGSLTWDSGNSWFDGVRSQASVGSYTFTTSSGSEATYGITALYVGVSNPTGIWDKIIVTISANVTNPTVGDTVEFTVSGKYKYDNTDVTTLSFQVTRNGSNYADATPFTDMQESELTYHYTTVSASETTYGLSTFSTNTITVTWGGLFIETYELIIDDARADVGSNVYLRYHLRYSGNQSDVGPGTLWVNGTSHSISSGWANFTVTSSSVGKALYTVTAVDVGGETDYGQIPANPEIIWDRMEIILATADDTRINVGDTFEARFRLRYDYDNVIFDSSKGTISIEGLSATWDDVNYWWDRGFTGSSSVGATDYHVTFSDTTYGLTTSTGTSYVTIITDRIRWDTVTADDTRVNINSASEIRITASLEYDSHVVGSGDSLSIEGIALTWDSVDLRWEVSQTKSTVQAVVYDAITGSEATYGITAINNNAKTLTVIWDGLEVVSLFFTPLGEANYSFTVKMQYDYDDVAISGGTVKFAKPDGTVNSTLTTNSTGHVSVTLTQENITQTGGWKFYGFNEPNYGITYMSQNQTVNIYALTLYTTKWTGENLDPSGTITMKYGGTTVNQPSNGTEYLYPTNWAYDIDVVWYGITVNGTSDYSFSANKTQSLRCNVWEITINARDADGAMLTESPTNFTWTFPNATLVTEERNDGSWTFDVMNGTSYYRIKYQDVWVSVNTSIVLNQANVQIIHKNCWVYSLTAYVTSSTTGEELSGASMTLNRSDIGNINGLYNLPSSPTASYYNTTHARYVWSQLANQTSSYIVEATMVSVTGSTTTSLTGNTEISVSVAYTPTGGGGGYTPSFPEPSPIIPLPLPAPKPVVSIQDILGSSYPLILFGGIGLLFLYPTVIRPRSKNKEKRRRKERSTKGWQERRKKMYSSRKG